MAGKTKEMSTARFMYVEQGKDGKEIAAAVRVSENTISSWIKKGHWKAERDARVNSLSQRAENIKRVISNLSEQTLNLQEQRKVAVNNKDIEEVRNIDEICVGIGDQVSKYSKALALLDKNNRITLDVYLQVMQEIFNALRAHDMKLYMQTIDFQEAHVQHVSVKLG